MTELNELYLKVLNNEMIPVFEERGGSSIKTCAANCIYEDVAFYKLPREFADFIINKFLLMKDKKIPELNIDIKERIVTN